MIVGTGVGAGVGAAAAPEGKRGEGAVAGAMAGLALTAGGVKLAKDAMEGADIPDRAPEAEPWVPHKWDQSPLAKAARDQAAFRRTGAIGDQPAPKAPDVAPRLADPERERIRQKAKSGEELTDEERTYLRTAPTVPPTGPAPAPAAAPAGVSPRQRAPASTQTELPLNEQRTGSVLDQAPVAPARGPTTAGGAAARTANVPTPEAAGLEAGQPRLTARRVGRAVISFFNPMALSSEARATGGVVREQGARAFLAKQQAQEQLKTASKIVGDLPKAPAIEVWDAAEHWNEAGIREKVAKIHPDLPAQIDLFHRVGKRYEKDLTDLGILQQTIDGYVGRFWQQTPEKNVAGAIKGTRPLEGPKSFTKLRTFDNFTDGLKAGKVPLTYNFVDGQLLKFEEMGRAISGRRMVAVEEGAGRGKWVTRSQEIPTEPDGTPWVRVGDGKDPAFTMYAGPKSLEPVGHYYAAPDAAAVWHNHLMTGLQSSPLYQAMLIPGRAATQILLGVSGYHALNIAAEAAFSELALGVESLAHGELADAAASMARAPASPLSGLDKALKIRGELLTPGSFPEHAPVLDAMLKGGYRFTGASEFLKGDRVKAFKEAFNQAVHGESIGKQAWGATKAVPDAVSAAIETMATPVLGKYVPLMKLYATYSRVAEELKRLPADATEDVMRAKMSDIVNEMDYRFGQVIYENHFINKVAKDVAQFLFLAPGWEFGSAALMKRAFTNPKTAAWAVGSILGTATINGIMTYAQTGEMPHGWDYLAARDGTTNADGNPNRHTLPGNLMGPIYGLVRHPVRTAENWISPSVQLAYSLFANRDYKGNQIWNPLDDFDTKGLQLLKRTAQTYTPISLQNLKQMNQQGEVGAKAVGTALLGIKPARAEITRTPAQNLISDYYQEHHVTETPEQAEASDARSQAIAKLKGGDAGPIADLAKKGEISRAQLKQAEKNVGQNRWAGSFRGLPLDVAEAAFQKGTPQEQGIWKGLLDQKRRNAARTRASALQP